MSGASALSAAKRRRGAQSINESETVRSGVNTSGAQAPGKSANVKYTPIQLLQQHHLRIAELEKRETPDTTHASDFTSLEKRLDVLEGLNKFPKQSESIEDLEFFKQKTLMLEKEISNMRQTMMKIQNYAMETSMSVIKIKNGMEIEEQNTNDIDDNKKTEIIVPPVEVPVEARIEVPVEASIEVSVEEDDFV